MYETIACVSSSTLEPPIVGNPRVILIDSLFHHPWIHLVTFDCLQSNMHDLCDLFLPNEIMCYVCVLLFCFGGAIFKPTWRKKHVLLWNVMKICAFLQLIIIFSMSEIVPVSIIIV